LQAILFYAPRWLWKNWERGKLHALVMNLEFEIISPTMEDKKKLLVEYLHKSLGHNNFWAFGYYLFEFLALVNVIGEDMVSTSENKDGKVS